MRPNIELGAHYIRTAVHSAFDVNVKEDGAYDHMGGESCGEGKIWKWKIKNDSTRTVGWVCEV